MICTRISNKELGEEEETSLISDIRKLLQFDLCIIQSETLSKYKGNII